MDIVGVLYSVVKAAIALVDKLQEVMIGFECFSRIVDKAVALDVAEMLVEPLDFVLVDRPVAAFEQQLTSGRLGGKVEGNLAAAVSLVTAETVDTAVSRAVAAEKPRFQKERTVHMDAVAPEDLGKVETAAVAVEVVGKSIAAMAMCSVVGARDCAKRLLW